MATKISGGNKDRRCPTCKLQHCICKIKEKQWDESQEEKEKCSECGLVYCICKKHSTDDL